MWEGVGRAAGDTGTAGHTHWADEVQPLTKRIGPFGHLVGDGESADVLNEGPEEFCDRMRTRLVGAMVLACGDHAVGEELAQEALVRAWQQWTKVRGLDSPESWVFRVAFNLSNSWHRRRMAEWRANRRSESGVPEGADDIDRAAILAVREAVAALPPRQRAVVVARFYLGHDVASAAALLECAEGTVKAATHQALANLRAAGLMDVAEQEIVR